MNLPDSKPASPTARVALVAGASGMVGQRLAEHVNALPAWEVLGLARKPLNAGSFPIFTLDLMCPRLSTEQEDTLKRITHIFYAARYDHHVHAREPVDENVRMLKNLIEVVGSLAPNLEHIHIVQGTKYYGFDFGLGAFKTPAKESDGRSQHVCWYYPQEDYVEHLCKQRGWTWSASRPHGVCDDAVNVTRSLARVISVYAAICRETGQPLYFPGRSGNFRAIYQCTESALLARAIVWMASEPRCANQAFNVTNGDFIRWGNLWPRFAHYFQVRAGSVRTISLEHEMPQYASVWNEIVRKKDLIEAPIERAALWSYADAIFSSEYDIMSDTTKLRQFGFCEAIDTEEMFIRLFDRLRSARVIP